MIEELSADTQSVEQCSVLLYYGVLLKVQNF